MLVPRRARPIYVMAPPSPVRQAAVPIPIAHQDLIAVHSLSLSFSFFSSSPIINSYLAGGVCFGTLALAESCTASDQCSSGFCADGLCCDSTCGGQVLFYISYLLLFFYLLFRIESSFLTLLKCEHCNKSGNCVATSGAPVSPRTACATDGSACGGFCNNAATDKCTYLFYFFFFFFFFFFFGYLI
jgi:hypothetical protein